MSTKCITPFMVENKFSERVPVPCGSCPNCRARRISGWSFRLMQEQKRSFSSLFVTLTYDTSFVPITQRGFMSLDKTDVQKFFKRLRKDHQVIKDGDLVLNPIKYYACGEYGSKWFRPHYHMVLFNSSIEAVLKAWAVDNVPIGNVHFGKVNEASTGYTLKYMCKVSRVPLHVNDDRIPEFALMSKGLGENYVTEKTIKWHNQNLHERAYLPLPGGKKAPMPRYYKNRIYQEEKIRALNLVTKERMERDQATLIDTLSRKYLLSIEDATRVYFDQIDQANEAAYLKASSIQSKRNTL